MANSVSYVSYEHAAGGSVDLIFNFVVTFSGSYVNGAGETVNFLAALNPNGLELNGFLPATTVDSGVPDYTQNVQGFGVQVSAYNAGSVVVKFYSAPGTELSSEAYPAGISGGQITFNIRHRG